MNRRIDSLHQHRRNSCGGQRRLVKIAPLKRTRRALSLIFREQGKQRVDAREVSTIFYNVWLFISVAMRYRETDLMDVAKWHYATIFVTAIVLRGSLRLN